MSKKKKDAFSRAVWVRQVLIRRPEITLEQLQKEYDKGSKRPKSKRPNSVRVISQARKELCKRYGVYNIDELPRTKQGKVVTAGMIRLFLDKFGADVVFSKAESYLAADGLSITSGQFSTVRAAWSGVDKKAKAEESPDPNQHTGPRARKAVPRQRRKNRKPDRLNKTDTGSLELLLSLKACVAQAGGFAETREALKLLEQLQELPN